MTTNIEEKTGCFTNLNPKYTFENFVVSENGKLTYEASIAVAKEPGQKFNPLHIYGEVGLGKTHLMQAVGHYILHGYPEKNVKYVKLEEFTNQLVDCLKPNKSPNDDIQKFRQNYRNLDVLLIDDIHFIEGKARTEEEIFWTFDILLDAGKQIVFTSDRPIADLTALSSRLKSRLKSGLSVNIQLPDIKTRIAILQDLAFCENLTFSDEVILKIAEICDKDIFELKGVFNKVKFYTSAQGTELTAEKVEEILA